MCVQETSFRDFMVKGNIFGVRFNVLLRKTVHPESKVTKWTQNLEVFRVYRYCYLNRMSLQKPETF